MTLLLGLDIGTTRTKLVLWESAEARIVASASIVTPVLRDEERGDLRDADALWQAIIALLDELRAGGAELDRVSGISAASVGEEIVFVNERGESIGPIATWYAPTAEAGEVADRPSNRLASWYALRARSRESLIGATGFTDLGSYLLMRFAGQASPVTDLTHASRMGLLRDDAPEWSSERLSSCGVEHLSHPRILLPGEKIGELSAEVSRRTGLTAGIAVRAGAHDHIAAAHAAGVRASGQVFVSSGTSETQLVLTDAAWPELAAIERPGLEFGGSVDGALRYLHVSQPAGLRVAEICAADESGRSIEEIYLSLDRLLDDSASVLIQHAPQQDTSAVRLFEELEQQARISAETTRDLLALGQTESGRVTVVGVPTTQPSWRAIRSRISPNELVFSAIPEASAVGAAMLAAGPVASTATFPDQQNGAS